MKKKEKVIGIVGVPSWELMQEYKAQGYEIVDLDDQIPRVRMREGILPNIYCSILKRVVSNTISLWSKGKLELVLVDVSIGKCDGMRYISSCLQRFYDIPVREEANRNRKGFGYPICQSQLSLKEKMELIVQCVREPLDSSIELKYTEPHCGFWGVPPFDFSILELFPANTHIYGWTRCMENKTPSDHELELEVDKGVPTIFFAQSFCQKAALAYNLARRYGGMYVETDKILTRSTAAKIEAFLNFHVK
jgi:hypothetical protein